MSGEHPTTFMVPYFWSDQYGKKIQMLGHPHPSDDVVLVSGVVALSHPRGLALAKPLLESPTTLDDALNRSPWSS